MRHSISIDGEAFSLRPVGLDDCEFIVNLRSDPALSQFINKTSPDPNVQREWIKKYFDSPGDYYFIIERRAAKAAEGTVGIYGVDTEAGTAEWGRWILQPQSLGAVESVMLIYRIAFQFLGLESVHCRTLAKNSKVVSFHTSCGLEEVEITKNAILIDGIPSDVVEQRLTRGSWLNLEQKLASVASRTARLLAEGDA